MVQNLPSHFTNLATGPDWTTDWNMAELTIGSGAETIDYMYMPLAYQWKNNLKQVNVGYVFLNFVSPEAACAFCEAMPLRLRRKGKKLTSYN